MKKGYLVLMSLWLFAALAQPAIAPLGTEEEARALAEAVMQEIVAGEYQAAIEKLKPYWPFPEAELDELIATTVDQRSRLEPRFGTSLGHKLVQRETVGDALLRLTYLERTDRQVLRWLFLFYRPTDTWILNSISWDDDVEPLFLGR
jgi:hypothetical protein